MPETDHGASIRVIAIWTRRQTDNGPLTRPEGGGGMTEGTFVGTMKADERGWPQIRFAPESASLRAVGALLQEGVGIFVPACDDLLLALRGVLRGAEDEFTWNGDRYLLRGRRDLVSMTDLYGEAGVNSVPVTIETVFLAAIVEAWRDFGSELPRQREFAEAGKPDPLN
jgi:hypothetical protein